MVLYETCTCYLCWIDAALFINDKGKVVENKVVITRDDKYIVFTITIMSFTITLNFFLGMCFMSELHISKFYYHLMYQGWSI